MDYITHITSAGERWDQLAQRYYGSAYRYPPIIAANPHVPTTATLPAGVRLAIPVLEEQTATEDLPPWLR
ncbi:tail protein X [Stutzerimonas kirkiae]|uniref:tail protein X n=1 Tax=Stutzerimonas kirkiae TaxID=2211392 RepID=UPI0010383E6B|nr:tail protein X [Stutzerimonas kirkiae]TBV10265.1 hypothetical protein DNK08_07240 [Stutzerimonas kirkiae]